MENRRKRVYDLVQAILKAEKDIRLAVVEAKTKSRRDMTGGNGHAQVSDPTAGQAERLLSPVPVVRVDGLIVKQPEAWLYVIQQAYAASGEGEREMARRYFSGEKVVAVAVACGFEPPTVYNAIRSFTNWVIAGACQQGLVRVI